MVQKHGSLTKDEEINEASWVAARGAAAGAAKWGLFSLVAAGAGYAFSPLYRGLTFQFKVFLQMSGMTAGAIIDADRRLIAHEQLMRNRKKVARDAEVWRRYEEDYQQLLDEANAKARTKGEE
ncbi:Putative respiratory complex factor Rcf3 [Septoria linicola]|uniref:Respiratory complex factor Rcf3 n=1 Tax=Septoria linicola TaxID=215465 RepID=A0A9Q9EJU1_9PEZI|nr:putative respiratory complex factor Rcf3 [Septoria linicola]USW51708.1 Putative respiratory complex factor Rcf3 [Septoria linicola]